MNKFSFYENGIKNTIPLKDITITELLDLLKRNNPLIEAIRKEPDKDKRQILKRKLSYVTFAGVFNNRAINGLKKASGLACFDIDDIENKNLDTIKDKLIKDKYTHLLFLSPSGNGFKVIVKIPDVVNDEQYKKYWISIAEHYNLSSNDEASKDISRACYVSVDNEPFFNPNSEIYTHKVEDISMITATNSQDNKKKDTSFAKLIESDFNIKNLFEGNFICEKYPDKFPINKDLNKSNLLKFLSPSEAEQSLVCRFILKGLDKEQIFKIMSSCLLGDWQKKNIQYRELTYKKAIEIISKEKQSESKEIKPTEETLNILKNPNLFNLITETEFDKKIVSEIPTRKVIFLCACGRLVKNCQIASYNLLVNDDAGIGKDYITHAVLEILPKDCFIHKTRISPAVFTYWHNEPDWTWDGKVFYPEDISEIVLNSDVFKVMTSKGSSATIVIKQKAVEINIQGKPVMITTTATATPSPELTRRFVILNLDSSEDQTKAIMKRHSKYKKEGILPEYNEDYRTALSYLKRVSVKVPFADLIDKHFPTKSIIMRTHYPRFLDFICASASFHQYQRKEDEEGFILAEGQDYDIARECFIKLCSNKYMIPLTINQKKILEIFEKEPTPVSVSKFHGNHNFMALKNLITNFDNLCKYGLLTSSTIPDAYGRDMEIYYLSKGYNLNEKISIPTYTELMQNEVSKVRVVSEVSKVSKVSNSQEDLQGDGYDTYHVYPIKDINNDCIIDKTPIKCAKCNQPAEYIVKQSNGRIPLCLNHYLEFKKRRVILKLKKEQNATN